MANLYTLDKFKCTSGLAYVISPDVIAKIEAAIKNAKIPPAHSKKFIDAYKGHASKLKTYCMDAQKYIAERLKGQGLFTNLADQGAVQKALMVAIMGPQKVVLVAKFDISVHFKAPNIELQVTTCAGANSTPLKIAP